MHKLPRATSLIIHSSSINPIFSNHTFIDHSALLCHQIISPSPSPYNSLSPYNMPTSLSSPSSSATYPRTSSFVLLLSTVSSLVFCCSILWNIPLLPHSLLAPQPTHFYQHHILMIYSHTSFQLFLLLSSPIQSHPNGKKFDRAS